jgi:hypothetical protein
MESLGHYLLRGRIALPGGSATEVYEGQDIRTGIEVLAFKPLTGEPPRPSLPNTLTWIDREKDVWIAEIPIGAVQTSLLAGRVEVARLLQWVKQLLGVLKHAQEQDIPVGYILPELIWARGSRIWLGGVGVANPEQKWDFAGLLNTVRVIAGDAYPALPWREALEHYVTGQLEYAALAEQLETAGASAKGGQRPVEPSEPMSSLEAEGASGGGIKRQFNLSQDASSSLETLASGRTSQETSPPPQDPSRVRSERLEARRARAQGERVDSVSHEERASPSLETLASGRTSQETPPPSQDPSRVRSERLEARKVRASGESPVGSSADERASNPETTEPNPSKPATSKSLKVQVSEPTISPPAAAPPRRIRIEDRLEPPFEVVEPPPTSRRSLLVWLWIIPLLLLAGGIGLWLRSRIQPTLEATVYPVEFRLQPPGSEASIVVLEIPEGSKMPLGVEIAQVPGRVDFDQPGIYRIRVRVQGRAPVESLIEVPNPGGVTISLR